MNHTARQVGALPPPASDDTENRCVVNELTIAYNEFTEIIVSLQQLNEALNSSPDAARLMREEDVQRVLRDLCIAEWRLAQLTAAILATVKRWQ